MDRTDEFMKIIRSTHIPQQHQQPLTSPYMKTFNIDSTINKNLVELDRTLSKERIYESFTLQSKMDKIREMAREMKEGLNIPMEYKNDQEASSYSSLRGIIKNRIARHLLKLTELNRKRDTRSQVAVERRQEFESESSQGHQDVVLMENEVVTERIKERQKISMQISEIGQIMEEISMHVSLQEESFKRIDDLMGTSDTLISSSLDLMRKTWENVSNTRPAIIKFITFWIVLALIFWLLRR